jgi:hypothetical protein
MDNNNITVRKQQLLRSNSESDLTEDEFNSTMLDSTMLSTYSETQNETNTNQNNEYYLQEITILKNKLCEADQEIDNLTLECNKLKGLVVTQKRQIETLKILTTEIGSGCVYNKKTMTPLRNRLVRINRTLLTRTTPINSPRSVLYNTPIKLLRENETTTAALPMSLGKPCSTDVSQQENTISSNSYNYSNQSKEKYANISEEKKRRLTFISSNNKNKIFKIARSNAYMEKFHIFHHVTPGCGVLQLLKYAEKEAQQLTHSDYCVLLIGEEDFRRSSDYVNIVQCIRQSLSKIQNTNIVISAPTYIYGLELYNCRVEHFNSLLFLDVSSHNYAYLYDSNLTLDYDMFSLRTGKLNNVGMRDVIGGIRNLMINTDRDNDMLLNQTADHITDKETQTEPINFNNNSTHKSPHLFRL